MTISRGLSDHFWRCETPRWWSSVTSIFLVIQQTFWGPPAMPFLRFMPSAFLVTGLLLATPARAQDPLEQKAGQTAPSKEPGLLFYLSGDHGFNADYAAGGDPHRTILKDVKILPGGAKGSYLQCGDNQLLSYWAPGNIYSQRGTLDF